MRLRDLTLETQHRGHVLIVRTFAVPVKMSAIHSPIEDEYGDVEQLAIYNLHPSTQPGNFLPDGSIVAIKEPYYKRTSDGNLFVRVDHPTDFLILKPGHKMIPPGRVAAGNFEAAVDLYSDALLEAAATDLGGEKYEEAAAASDSSLFRAGRAAYELEGFAQARQHFSRALELDASHAETRLELARTAKRLAEQQSGKLYSVSTMAKEAAANQENQQDKHQHLRLDHASFLKRTKIAQTENRGRGLFATEKIKAGDIVLAEKAFAVPQHLKDDSTATMLINVGTNRIPTGLQSRLLQATIDKMTWNPTCAKRYLELFDGGKFKESDGGAVQVVDGRVVVDTFQVQAIAELNAFASEPADEEGSGGGGGGGEPFCGLCHAESQDNTTTTMPMGVLGKRALVAQQIKAFLSANKLTSRNVWSIPAAKKAQGCRLLAQVRETYMASLFARLPRPECVGIGLWVARATSSENPHQDLPQYLEVLRDLGYFVAIQGHNAVVDLAAPYPMIAAVHAMMHASDCLKVVGKAQAALVLKALARRTFVGLHGSEDEFLQFEM
ncbi:hypothetical protein SCUCBS95973_000491 [Sporothrix curviconia]|uniref:Uncharacterized protein n=1 Tax=Sporothrix curviconia TaxID=1260050 RepID=A0ABP0AQT9_9PEZI